MTDITLVLDKKTKVVVKGSWVPRWHFLADIVGDMGVTSLPWSYTGSEELKAWVILNRAMDKKGVRNYELLPLSAMWDTVRYMHPVTHDYLLYCYIDQSLPEAMRKTSYGHLGAMIRKKGEKPSYLQKRYKMGIHRNFGLSNDPAYGLACSNGRTIELREMKEDVRELLLGFPLDIITGILHQAHFKKVSKAHTPRPEDKYMNEVPWDLIPWNDVALFADGTWKCLESNLDFNRVARLVERDWRAIERCPADDATLAQLKKDTAKKTRTSLLVAVLSGIGESTPDREDDLSRAVKFQVEISEEKFHFKMVNFAAYWDCLIAYMMKQNGFFKDFTNQEASIDMIFALNKKPWNVVSGEYNSGSSIAILHTFLFCHGPVSRNLDSTEYPSVCRRMASTLGTYTLEHYSNILLTIMDKKKDLSEIEKQRIVLFCEAAIEVLGSTTPCGFTCYPSAQLKV